MKSYNDPAFLKVLMVRFFIGTLFCTLAVNSKADEVVFDPLETIYNSQQGRELVELYYQADAEPEKVEAELEVLNNQGAIDENPYYKAIYYRIKHNIILGRTDIEQAEVIAKAMYQYGQDVDQQWVVAEALTLKGILAARQGEGDKAKRLIDQAIELASQLNYHRLWARALNARGVLHSRDLQYEASLNDYHQAISLLLNIKYNNFLSKVYSNISVVYSRVKDWPNAIKYNELATDLYINSGAASFEHLVVLYSNASHIMLQVNDIEAATDFSQKSTAVARKSNNAQLVVNALWTQGELLINQQRYLEAESIVMECIELSAGMYDPLARNQCLYGLSQVRLYQQNFEDAETNALQALAGFTEINNQDFSLSVHQLLANLYQQTERFPQAITHLIAYYEGRKKQLFDKREEQIFELQMKFDTQLQEEKIALLTAENELAAATLEKKGLQEKLWMLVLGISFIGLVFLIHRYVTHEKRIKHLSSTNKNLFMQSNKDPLTGLHNRRYLENFVEHKAIRSQVSYYSVLMLDCDKFKNVNDTYGHEVGDEVLKTCAERLQSCIRGKDILARWGGEEFMVLLALESAELQPQVLKRFNNVIAEQPMKIAELELSVSISIGATMPVAANELVKGWLHYKTMADVALYQAKGQGRNCAVISRNEEVL
ncbi:MULTISPECIES: diguanylate cyclase [unclassified Shewanella]|uniref:tetratricopeptide repeat-containing diguanylate cyclase n=1 Tax=unclassified Shewanella TaxID=196818 RepID=UPI003553F515